MNKKMLIGLLFGTIAGLIDVIPMMIQKLSWDANISAFVFWVISGFMISITVLKINSFIKGILISALVLIPAAVLVGFSEPVNLIPMSISTVVLGGSIGLLIERFSR